MPSADGTNFALYSADAEAVELVLFDTDGIAAAVHALPDCVDGVWHGFLPGCRPGQAYGYRVHGRYAPAEGLRFNPCKLLLDPYAREIRGPLQWRPEIFDYVSFEPIRGLKSSDVDSAKFVPKSIVHGDLGAVSQRASQPIPWAETVIYETNVRGYTMLHPAVSEADRGTFRGMRHREVLAYLKALGITSVELMPVHAFVDEEFLVEHGLRNYWGYNTIGFFAPAERLGADRSEFRAMVDAIHDAGLEVILDVVYNHTAEGGKLGPTLSFRGIDNRTYYRLLPEDRSEYVNDTGVGNTIDTDRAAVRRLVLDSLKYWSGEMGVDGFRFDLASILGRRAGGFDREHPFFVELAADPALAGVKLIAEPWDVGPGGYRLGGFPAPWAEWNDRFRDAVRQFWRGDPGLAPEFARRLHGSADIFEPSGRGPESSVNFVTAHDGFTLADTVSYAQRHNEANGEGNRDGHVENYSCNHGVEGETDDTAVLAARRRQRLNMLATLLFAQGTPMLLGGDEFGNSQQGNNNAYAQDNPIGWIDWAAAADEAFTAEVRRMISLRRGLPVLRQTVYRHGEPDGPEGFPNILWFGQDGEAISDADWHTSRVFGVVFTSPADEDANGELPTVVSLLLNACTDGVEFALPDIPGGGRWRVEYSTADLTSGLLSPDARGVMRLAVPAACIVCLALSG